MFGLGFWEIAIILGILLIVFGPSKLPDLAKGLGKGLREFRKATEDFKSTIEDEMNRPDHHPQSPQSHAAAMLPPQAPAPSRTNLPPPAHDEIIHDHGAHDAEGRLIDHDREPQPAVAAAPQQQPAPVPQAQAKPKPEAEHVPVPPAPASKPQ